MTAMPLFRRTLALITLACSSLALALPAHAEVVFQDITSPKGINAWLVEDYTVPIVTIRFAFEGGSAQEPQGKEGLTDLLTTLFDEGAGDLDSEAFQIALDNAGAEMGFTAGPDAVQGAMRMLVDQSDEAVNLLRLAVQEPRFDQDPIDRMRAQLITGIAASAQRPGTAAKREWAAALYGDHPYARNSDGTVESLNSITADDLRTAYRDIFARDNLHVGIVGAINAEDAAALLDTVFGALPEKPNLTPIPDITPKLGQSLRVDYDLPQTSILMAYPGVERTDPNYFAALLMTQILGGDSFGSWLTTEVREKRGLTYSISASLDNAAHSQSLTIATATRADRAAETLDVIKQVVARMAQEGPSTDELAEAKKYLIGSYPIDALSSSSAIASALVGLQMWDLGIDYIDRRAALINAATVDDVKAMANRLLTVEPTILQMGPVAAPEAPAALAKPPSDP